MGINKQEICEVCDSDDYEFIDVFGLFDLTDQHYTIVASKEELSKRLSGAIELSKKLNYPSSGFLEEELGKLISPKFTWEDFCYLFINRLEKEKEKNNWSKPKIKELSAGFFLPKREGRFANTLVLLDCSGSMKVSEIAYLTSQLQAFGQKIKGYVVCFDHQPYYEEKLKFADASLSELQKIKLKGGGGTLLVPIFSTYEKELGNFDLIIILTDGGIFDLAELSKLKPPSSTEILWLLTSHNNFNPPFGRVFHIFNN